MGTRLSEFLDAEMLRMNKSGGIYRMKSGMSGLGSWIVGTEDGHKVEVKAYDEPSVYGINGGQVSKLHVSDPSGKTVASYDRGWDVKPSDPGVKKLVMRILGRFPNRVDPADVDPKTKFEEGRTMLKLEMFLGEAGDPVAHWTPVTGKIMRHEYFAVSGKLAAAKIACAWRGNGEGYAVVDPTDVGEAKAVLGRTEESVGPRRLAAVLNEDASAAGRFEVPSLYGKDAEKFLKRKGECDDAGKGKSAVRGLRAAVRSAEEDLTPDAAKRLGVKGLGEGVEVMSVDAYKSRWMSGHENPEVKRAEREGKDLRVTVQHSPFGSFAVGIEAVPKGTKESVLRLGRVLDEKDMLPGSVENAKKNLKDFMAKKGYKYDSLSAKTIGFSDLARGSSVFVTVKGLQVMATTWAPMVQDIKRFGRDNGFVVDFSGIVKDGQPVVTAESVLRLGCVLEGGSAMYGIGEPFDFRKYMSDLSYKLNVRPGDTVSMKSVQDALKGNWDRPLLNKIKQALSDEGIKVTEAAMPFPAEFKGLGPDGAWRRVFKSEAELSAWMKENPKAVVTGWMSPVPKGEQLGPKALKATLDKEEDMTPEVGAKMGRPELGRYGRKAEAAIRQDVVRSYVDKFMDKRPASGVPEIKGWVDGIGAAATDAEKEAILRAILGNLGKGEAAVPELRLSKNMVVQMFDGDALRHVLGSKTGVATDKSGANWEFNAVGDKWDLRKVESRRPGAVAESRRKPGAALEDAIRQAKDALANPRRNAKGQMVLVGEAVSSKLKAAADEADKMIDAHEKGAEADADFDAGEFSGPAHGRTIDRELDAIAKKHGVGRGELDSELHRRANESVGEDLKSPEEYAALAFEFMKSKGDIGFDKAWQQAVDVKGVGIPMYLWGQVKRLVQAMFTWSAAGR